MIKKKKPTRSLKEILEVKALLLDVLMGQIRMEINMTVAFENVRAAVEAAKAAMLEAIDKIRALPDVDDPAAMQAVADDLTAAVAGLSEALHPAPV